VGGGMDKILATKGLLLPGPRKRLLSLSPFLFLFLSLSIYLPFSSAISLSLFLVHPKTPAGSCFQTRINGYVG